MSGSSRERIRAAIAPPPADVGIVAALPIEVEPFLLRLKRVRKYSGPRHRVIEGELGDQVVALLIAGVGRKPALRATRLLLDGHRPAVVISTGFAGALDPALKLGDALLPAEVLEENGTRWPLASAPEGIRWDARIHAGRLLTVERIVRTAAEKSALRERLTVDAVDMETAAVAAVCAERGARLLGVRVISDDATSDLPPEILSVFGPTGGFRVGATVGSILKRPSSLKDLWVLRTRALEAADRLAALLTAVIARLPGA